MEDVSLSVFTIAGLTLLAGLILIYVNHYKPKGRTFYVSNEGDDANPGTRPKWAWRSLEKVNSFEFLPGDTVCFRKGDVWRGQLIPRSGSQKADVTYTSYGYEEEKPKILGSVSRGQEFDWILSEENIWRADVGSLEIGNVIFNYDQCGKKVGAKRELTSQGEFYNDTQTGELFIYSNQNPALLYSGIECAQSRFIIDQTGKRFVSYNGLTLKYSGSHGIGGEDTANIKINDCDISFIGGADLHRDGENARFGNGIELSGNARNITVEKCNIYEIYDAAVANENRDTNCVQKNIIFRRNNIWKCEYSFLFRNASSESATINFTFENNYCKDAGGGWAHSQRPDNSGRHLYFPACAATVKNFSVKGNIFENAAESLIYVDKGFENIDSVKLTNNRFIQQNNPVYALWQNKEYRYLEFEKLKRELELDRDKRFNI